MSTQILPIEEAKTPADCWDMRQKAMASLGRDYTPSFIEALIEAVYDTLKDWLGKNAPEPIVELLGDLDMLANLAGEMRHGPLDDSDAAELALNVPAVTRHIREAGADICSVDVSM